MELAFRDPEVSLAIVQDDALPIAESEIDRRTMEHVHEVVETVGTSRLVVPPDLVDQERLHAELLEAENVLQTNPRGASELGNSAGASCSDDCLTHSPLLSH